MPVVSSPSPTPLATGLLFGESPRFKDGVLYISDMTGRAIYIIDIVSREKQVLTEMENQPNGICFAPDGSLIYSSMLDAKLYRRDPTGHHALYADMKDIMNGYCGDMAIDSRGRVYIGDTGARVLHGEQPRPGRLLIVEMDGAVDIAEENIIFPNALFISNDARTIYCAETFGQGLIKWDLGSNGKLSNRRLFWSPASISTTGKIGNTPEGIIGIDGGCMDSEGGIWLSMLSLEKFIRLDQQGTVTDEIQVDGHATACTLGGHDGKTLFLVTNGSPKTKKASSRL